MATVAQIANSTFGSLKSPNHGMLGDTMPRTVFTVASTRGDGDDGDAGPPEVGAAAVAGEATGATVSGPYSTGAPAAGVVSAGRIARRNGLHDASTGISSRAPSETNHTRWRETADPRSMTRVTAMAASNRSVALARIITTDESEKRAVIGLISRSGERGGSCREAGRLRRH
jgi:hypothetical protein